MSTGLTLKRIGKATAAALKQLLPPFVNQDQLADAIGYVENAGNPNAAVTPDFIGQRCFDTTNGVMYVAKGTTNADWVASGTSQITGVTPGTAAVSKALVLDANGGVSSFRHTGSNIVRKQAAPAAKTVSAVVTGAELVAGLITGNQGGAAAATYTTDTGTAIETAHAAIVPGGALQNDDSFEFSVINISAVAAETITLAAGAGVTLVGDLTMAAIAVGDTSSGRFLARRTAANTYTIYRLA